MAPSKLSIRAYNVGFGDCLLLTFAYPKRDRHVLIDFGSTRAPKSAKSTYMMDIARDIEKICGDNLVAVVATHRHRDHISGFAPGSKGREGTGDVIRKLKPTVVLQPWTEDPDAPGDASAPVNDPGRAAASFQRALANMHAVAGDVEAYSRHRWLGASLRKQLGFLGEENLDNKGAVENLMTMGQRQVYGHYGSKSGLEKLLPGVKVFVLGPPTLKQSNEIRKQTGKSEDEFWHLYRGFQNFWALQAAAGRRIRSGKVFPGARTQKPGSNLGWFVDRLRAMENDNMLSIVRQLDDQMNNTSLILLFETGGKRFLFPGDAQLENWSHAIRSLEKAGKIGMLEGVDLYKVGHHGSLNATPKSLWRRFKKKGKQRTLKTVLSTRSGVHGSAARHTEVPRATLVQELKTNSTLFRTDEIRARERSLCRTIEIPLGS